MHIILKPCATLADSPKATLIALVCIAAWANCVYRARLFRNSVAHYNDSNPVNAGTGTTTMTTTTNPIGGERSSSTENSHEFATATVASATAAGTTRSFLLHIILNLSDVDLLLL